MGTPLCVGEDRAQESPARPHTGLSRAHVDLCRAAAQGAQQLYDCLLAKIALLGGPSRSALLLPADGPEGPSLMPVAVRGLGKRRLPARGFRLSSGSKWDELLTASEPVSLSDGRDRPGLRRMLGAEMLIAVPVRRGAAPYGLLLTDSGPATRAESDQVLPCIVELATTTAWLLDVIADRKRPCDALACDTLRSLPIGLVVSDSSGTVTLWNASIQAILGIAEESAIGRPLDRVLLLALETASAEPLLEAVDSAKESTVPMHLWRHELARMDGHRHIANIAAAPLSGEEPGVLVTVEDVSDRAALEGDMERMRHLAQLGQMTAQIAHELRNPLTSIRGAAQILQQTEPDGPSAEFARIILQEVDSLNRIAEDFLDFARPLQLRTHPVHLRHLLKDFVSAWRPVCRDRGIELRLNVPRELPILSVDALRFNQVLRNLALNACQAMPTGGRLTLNASYHRGQNEVVITVRDTGVGLSEEDQARLFEPFFTTKPKGTGLGLAVVQKLVQAHGGRIEVTSKLGKGTAFSVRLPATSAAP